MPASMIRADSGGKPKVIGKSMAIVAVDLPVDPEAYFRAVDNGDASATLSDVSIIRFRPPKLERKGELHVSLPHIRLDRALQFLLGDRLA